MPLGIVSNKEFSKALEEPQVRPAVSIIEIEKPGRKEGDNNVPSALRNIIGETSQIDGRQEALAFAKQFDISPSSVSAYSSGKTSTSAPTVNQAISNHIAKAKEKISRKARRVMVRAIDNITDEKLEHADVTELAGVARNMSAIFKDMTPDENEDTKRGQNGPTFVFMVPPMAKEDKYPIITLRE